MTTKKPRNTSVAPHAPSTPPPPADQPKLPAASRTELQNKHSNHLVNQCRILMKRVGMDSMQLIIHLAELKRINAKVDFDFIIKHNLKLRTSTVYRWLTIADTVEKYFLSDDTFSSEEMNNFTQSTFHLICAFSVNDDAIEEVRSLLKGQSKLSTVDINEILSKKEYLENQVSVTNAIAELERTQKAAQQTEFQLAKARADEATMFRRLIRFEDHITALEFELKQAYDDYKKLSLTPREIEFVEKEIVPNGYKTIKEAMISVQSEIIALMEERSKLTMEVKDLQTEFEVTKARAEKVRNGAHDVNEFITQVDTLIGNLPHVLMQRMVANSPESKVVFDRLARQLMSFAKALTLDQPSV